MVLVQRCIHHPLILILTLTPTLTLTQNLTLGGLTAISFAVGAFTSIIAGYIGMSVAVFANARVTVEANPLTPDL